MRAALREAFGHNGFRLLTAGYFVCGFQVVFIGVHMPSYLKDHGLEPGVATTALALIGLFNVFGTYLAGSLGQRVSKPRLLSAIYLLRSLVIVVFISAPLTPWSVYLFAAAMGLLWLSTVPPTNAVVAQIFGVQYMSMLGGIVFLNHQLGSFLGAWLGGKLYDVHRQLRRGLVDLGGPGRVRGAGQLAGARNPDRAARAAAGVMPRGARIGVGLLAGGGAGGGVSQLPESRTWRWTWPTVSGPASDPPHGGLAAPSPWVRRWATLIRPGGRVLDLACGSGRHVRWLAAQGFAVTGVDRDAAALEPLRGIARVLVADLEGAPWPLGGRSASMRWSSPTTCGGRCGPTLLAALAEGGVLIYETFADGNQSVGKPTRPDFLLRHGELLDVTRGLRIVAYEDGFLQPPPRYVQRIAAVADGTPDRRYPLCEGPASGA